MSEQNLIMTVVGLLPSSGDFKNDSGEKIDFDNLNVIVLKDFKDTQKNQGAVGQEAVVYKINGSKNIVLYKDIKLPARARLIFNWDFNYKVPKAILTALDFNIKE